MKLTIAFAVFCAAITAQVPSPSTQGVSTPSSLSSIVSDPMGQMTVPVNESAVIHFRAQLNDGRTMSDLRSLPVKFVTSNYGNSYGNSSESLLEANCNYAIGECTISSPQPRMVVVSAMANGSFGYGTIVVSFVASRNSSPVRMDVSASQNQSDPGAAVTLTATSPLTYAGPVSINVVSRFANDSIQKNVYLPNGVTYGQRINLLENTDHPLSFRGRTYFYVTMSGTNGVLANGIGVVGGLQEVRQVDATITDTGDLVVTLPGPYNPAVDYTITLVRGNQFRAEMASARSELLVYGEGDQTKILFNRGSLRASGNAVYLGYGLYTVNVYANERTTGNNWVNSGAQALNVSAQLVLQ
jgi:hypothetical protein